MKKILKWFSLLFAVSVTIFVVFFFYSINADIVIDKPQPLEYESLLKKQEAQALWLNHLSEAKKKGYFFPVDEVYIQTDLKSPQVKNPPLYKLIVNDLDAYQMFCLKQELKRFGKKYFIQKKLQSLEVFVYAKDYNKLQTLTKVLRRYKIQAKIIKG